MNEPLPRNIPSAFTWQEQFSCPTFLTFYWVAVCVSSLEPSSLSEMDGETAMSQQAINSF